MPPQRYSQTVISFVEVNLPSELVLKLDKEFKDLVSTSIIQPRLKLDFNKLWNQLVKTTEDLGQTFEVEVEFYLTQLVGSDFEVQNWIIKSISDISDPEDSRLVDKRKFTPAQLNYIESEVERYESIFRSDLITNAHEQQARDLKDLE